MTELNHTILRVYDAAADDARWPDVLQRIADQIGAVGCIVFEWQSASGRRTLAAPMASSYYDPAQIARYVDTCHADECRDQDIFEAHSLTSDGVDLIDDSVIAPTLAELKARPNVMVLQKLGILHRAAGLLNKDNTAVCRFSVQLGADRGRFTSEERAYLSSVLPHVAKALDLGRPARQLAAVHQGLIAAMDQLSIGICILDASGRLVTANNEFRRQQEEFTVFSTRPDGRLMFSRHDDQRRFEELTRHAANHGRFGARPRKEAISTGPTTFLCIEATPLPAPAEIGTTPLNGIILYSIDTSKPTPCQTLPIQRAFGLTETEYQLVTLIAEGLTNVQIAERRDRSVATINAQVKSILSKTQCATRTQFVRLMMSFGADYLLPEDGADGTRPSGNREPG